MAEWTISRLAKDHDRRAFSCGKPPLDRFLHSLASQYEKRRIGRTFVATQPNSMIVLGYYTISAGAIDAGVLPAPVRKKLPDHPVPCILLGRLAVDQSCRGQGLGETLLYHGLKNALEHEETLGVYAVDVWAIDSEAVAFYERYGFLTLADHPRHLYLPIATVEGMFST